MEVFQLVQGFDEPFPARDAFGNDDERCIKARSHNQGLVGTEYRRKINDDQRTLRATPNVRQ